MRLPFSSGGTPTCRGLRDSILTARSRLDYIYNNPVTAVLADDPIAWQWSICAYYEKGVKIKLDHKYL